MEALPILLRTEHWVVIDKPTGMAVHRSEWCRDDVVVLQTLRDQLGQRVYPVHRLDRGTSGCLAMALSSEAARVLQASLAQAQKSYLAFVRGDATWIADRDEERPLEHDGKVREARTWLHTLGGGKDPRGSLVLAQPTTGRTHQIRRHLRGLNHPIVGDSKLGDTKVNRWWREQFGLDRLALHCYALEVPAPAGPFRVVAPLPDPIRSTVVAQPWGEAALAGLDARIEARASAREMANG